MGNSSDLTVDAVGGKGSTTLVVNDQTKDFGRIVNNEFVPVEKLSDIGVNTSEMEYRQWIMNVFKYDPTMSLMFLFPFLGLTLFGTYMLFTQTGQMYILPMAVLIPFVITYNILSRMITDSVIVIRKDENSGDYYGTEDEFWISDVREFPKECFHLNQETGKWVAWIDARDGVKIFDPWESAQVFSSDDVNASDVMGTAAYLKTTFNIGNMRPKKSLFEEAAPNLMMIGIGCVATFLAADRIAEMLNLQ